MLHRQGGGISGSSLGASVKFRVSPTDTTVRKGAGVRNATGSGMRQVDVQSAGAIESRSRRI